jgi:hypothetical protein
MSTRPLEAGLQFIDVPNSLFPYIGLGLLFLFGLVFILLRQRRQQR